MEKGLKANIGQRITQRRIKLGLSREQLADILGITSRFLFDIEAGKKGMSFETFIKIRRTLDVSADWLLDGEQSGGEWW